MKKLLMTLLLVLVSPMVLASASVEAPQNPYANQAGFNDQSQDPSQFQKHIQFLTEQEPTSPQDSMSLGSGDFGLFGPLSFSSIYSSTYGWIFSGQFTQAISGDNAISLLGDVGKKERRINATWGFAPTLNQRIKASAEYLSQDMDFNFYSGDVTRWEGQQAYGLAYEYLIPHHIINDINFDTFYSKANTYNLGNKLYDNDQLINLRRIAGGTDKSFSGGVDLLPFQTSMIGLQLNYDDVDYNTEYQNNQDVSGFGATVSLQQLLTHHLKLKLLASDRKPVNSYETEIDYLVKTKPGTRLEFGLNGTRSIAEGALTNDTQLGLNVNYSWGGADTKAAEADQGYQLSAADSSANVTEWTATPAVKMNQVYAVVDQAVQSADGKNLALTAPACDASFPHQNPDFTMPVISHPPGKIDINLGVLSTQTSGAGQGMFVAPLAYPVYHVTPTKIPNSQLELVPIKVAPAEYALHLQGTIEPDEASQTVMITAYNAFVDQYGPCKDGSGTIDLKLNFLPSITFTPPTMPWQFKTQQAITAGYYAQIAANGGDISSVTIAPEAGSKPLSDFGISSNAASIKGVSSAKLTFSGAPTAVTTQTETYDVTIKNTDGETGSGSFSLKILPGPPAIKIDKAALAFNNGGVVNQTNGEFATITADAPITSATLAGGDDVTKTYNLSVSRSAATGDQYQLFLNGTIKGAAFPIQKAVQKYTLNVCAGTGNCTSTPADAVSLTIYDLSFSKTDIGSSTAQHGEAITIPPNTDWQQDIVVDPTDAPKPALTFQPDTAAAAGCVPAPNGVTWNGKDAYSGTILDTAAPGVYKPCIDAYLPALNGTASYLAHNHGIYTLTVQAPQITITQPSFIFNNGGAVSEANGSFATVTADQAISSAQLIGGAAVKTYNLSVQNVATTNGTYKIYLNGTIKGATHPIMQSTQKYQLKVCAGANNCTETAANAVSLAIRDITFTNVDIGSSSAAIGDAVTVPSDDKWKAQVQVTPSDAVVTPIFMPDTHAAAGCSSLPGGLVWDSSKDNYSGTIAGSAKVQMYHLCIDAELPVVGGTSPLIAGNHGVYALNVTPPGAPVISDVKDLTFNQYTSGSPTLVTQSTGGFATITVPNGVSLKSVALTKAEDSTKYGLTVKFAQAAKNDSTYDVYLDGTISRATSSVQHYTIHACNNFDICDDATVNMNLAINSLPIMPKSSLGSGDVTVSQQSVNLPLDVSKVMVDPTDGNPPPVTQYNLLNSSTVGCADLPNGLTLTGAAAPIISGNLSPDVKAGTYPICITATNAVGTSANHSIYTLTVGGEAGAPQVTIGKSTLDFADKETLSPANSTFATVTLAAGQTIQSAELVNANPISDYGLTLANAVGTAANTYNIFFTGQATPATATVQHYTLRICDRSGKCGDGNVALSIHSVPHFVNSNLGGANVKASEQVTLPVSVSSANFQTPQPTDNPSPIVSYSLDTAATGCENPSDLGLTFSGGSTTPSFAGTISSTATTGIHTFCMTATNKIDQQSDNIGRFTLTVDASTAPTVKITKADLNVDKGATVSDAEGTFATVTATTAPTVSFVSGDVSDYGLTLKAVATANNTYDVIVSGTTTKATDSTQSYTLRVCEAADNCVNASAPLRLAINGEPSVSGDVATQGSTGQGESAVHLPVNLASVTVNKPSDNPLPVTYHLDTTDIGCQDPSIAGLSYNDSASSPALVGNVPNNAAVGAYTVCFKGSNRVGMSADFAKYTFNLAASTPPTVESNKSPAPFANGGVANEANSSFATIDIGSGQIDWSKTVITPASGSSPLSDFGLAADFAATASNGYEYKLFLSGAISKPTPTVQHYTVTVFNTYGKSVEVNLTLIIQSRPYFTQQSVGSSTHTGEDAVSLPIAAQVGNDPTGEGAPAALPVTYKLDNAGSGCTNPGSIGLSFNGTAFTGTLINPGQTTTYKLCVEATNSIGDSTAYAGERTDIFKHGEYDLTVQHKTTEYVMTCPLAADLNKHIGETTFTVIPKDSSGAPVPSEARTFTGAPVPAPKEGYNIVSFAATVHPLGSSGIACGYNIPGQGGIYYFNQSGPTPALPANAHIPGTPDNKACMASGAGIDMDHCPIHFSA